MFCCLVVIYAFGFSAEDDAKSLSTLKRICLSEFVLCEEVSERGDMVTIHFIGRLKHGEELFNSYSKNQTLSFTLGAGEVIEGWELGLIGMCVGEKRRLLIPSRLANGAKKDLMFDIEMMSITKYEIQLEKEKQKREEEKRRHQESIYNIKKKEIIDTFWTGKTAAVYGHEVTTDQIETNKNANSSANQTVVTSSNQPSASQRNRNIHPHPVNRTLRKENGECCSAHDLDMASLDGEWRSIRTKEVLGVWQGQTISLYDDNEDMDDLGAGEDEVADRDSEELQKIRNPQARARKKKKQEFRSWKQAYDRSKWWQEELEGMCEGDRKTLQVQAAKVFGWQEKIIKKTAQAENGVEFDFTIARCFFVQKKNQWWE